MTDLKMADVNCALMLFVVVGFLAALGLVLRRALDEGSRSGRKGSAGVLWVLAGLGGLALAFLIFLFAMDPGAELPRG